MLLKKRVRRNLGKVMANIPLSATFVHLDLEFQERWRNNKFLHFYISIKAIEDEKKRTISLKLETRQLFYSLKL